MNGIESQGVLSFVMHLPEFSAVGTLGLARWTRGQHCSDSGAVHCLRSARCPRNKENSQNTAELPIEGTTHRRPLALQPVLPGHERSNTT